MEICAWTFNSAGLILKEIHFFLPLIRGAGVRNEEKYISHSFFHEGGYGPRKEDMCVVYIPRKLGLKMFPLLPPTPAFIYQINLNWLQEKGKKVT